VTRPKPASSIKRPVVMMMTMMMMMTMTMIACLHAS